MLEVQNSIDGHCSFEMGSAVTIACTANPDAGVHTFKLNSLAVFACTGSVCKTIDNDNGAFSFPFDRDNGRFSWVIHNVDMKYNGKIFECIDDSTSINCTITVKG